MNLRDEFLRRLQDYFPNARKSDHFDAFMIPMLDVMRLPPPCVAKDQDVSKVVEQKLIEEEV